MAFKMEQDQYILALSKEEVLALAALIGDTNTDERREILSKAGQIEFTVSSKILRKFGHNSVELDKWLSYLYSKKLHDTKREILQEPDPYDDVPF